MLPLRFLRLTAVALTLSAATAVAQTPAFTTVNHGLDATFGNAGKAILAPQVLGLQGVAYGAGFFVVIGNSTREDSIRWATSADGTTWTPRSQTIGGGASTYTQTKVRFLNGKFMFFAVHTTTSASTTVVYTSADGLTWTSAKVADGNHRFEEFDSSPTLTVAAGSDGDQYASNDLVTWTARPVVSGGGLYSHNDLAFGNGRFFSSINGFGGATYSSTDAITWTAIPAAAVAGGGRVETGNGLVLLSGAASRLRSTDGITFTAYTPRTSSATVFLSGNDGRFTNGRFITTATDFATGIGRTLYVWSSDGLNWSPLANAAVAPASLPGTSRSYGYTDITFGNGKYVLVGSDVTFAAASTTYLPLVTVLDASLVPTVPTAPVITTPLPAAQNAVLGGSATFTIAVSGTGNTFQWRKDNVAIPLANAAIYTIASVTAASTGSYTVAITNAIGTTTSTPVVLSLVTASNVGRLINLSVLTSLDSPTDEFTLGYVVGGGGTTGAKPLVIRAAGPSLGAFGVPNTLPDPKLELFAGPAKTGENDNWGGSADLSAALVAVGAFAFTGPTSRDAAVAASISTRDNSVRVTGVGGATGAVIAEVYDASPASSFNAATPRLLNVSVRKHLGTGLTAGFVVGGSTSARVLIRVAGPGLAQFGVPGTVVDPQLALFNAQSVQITANDNWNNASDVTAAGNSVGAFALPASSRDAALVATLPPGNYSVLASGVNSTTGVALVEVYELP